MANFNCYVQGLSYDEDVSRGGKSGGDGIIIEVGTD
jgi:hypothetical protein